MGPRLGSRGKFNQVVAQLGLKLASMGPRLGSRGKGVSGRVLGETTMLQWGRDLEVAESGRNATRFLCNQYASMGPRLGSRGK